MTSLPLQVLPRLRDIPLVSTYDICLRLEKSLQEAANEGQDIGKSLFYIRIMGILVHHVPTDRGLETVIYEISSSADDSALLQDGKMYFDIRPCTFAPLSIHLMCQVTDHSVRANKGRTPMPYGSPSCPSFDTMADVINDTLVEVTTQSHANAKRM